MVQFQKHQYKLYFVIILTLRLSSIIVVQTYYVPDEYWQSLEVAHNTVYGYGYLTWEWREMAIRSCLYPSLIAFLYKILNVLHLDYRTAVIIFPRITQALITSLGDLYTLKLSNRLYGKLTVRWTFLSILSSWFLYYCGSRTIINSMETSLTAVTLYCFPWRRAEQTSSVNYFTMLAALTFICRPTSGILWIPLALMLMKTSLHLTKLLTSFLVIGFSMLVISVLCDRLFYHRWVFTLYNFVYFNVVSGLSGFYGTHPWHWYFSQGFPAIMGIHIAPFILALRGDRWKSFPVFLLFWQLIAYSFISHKEFRFIMPVLPLAFCLVGKYLSSVEARKAVWNARNLVIIMFITNIGFVFYFGRIWGRGPIQAIEEVAKELERRPTNSSVLFLMPCHSMPLYSHLHVNVSTRFLTCEPNLNGVGNYVDEADRFYQNKAEFIDSEFTKSGLPDLIVFYSSLRNDLHHFLNRNNYSLHRAVSHFGMFDERKGNKIYVYGT